MSTGGRSASSGRGRKRKNSCPQRTWTVQFVCLASRFAKKIPTATEKKMLHQAGWIMCTKDTRDRVSIDTSDRHLVGHSIDTRLTCRSPLGRQSVDMSTDTWSTLDQQRAIVGRVSTDSCVGRWPPLRHC